MRAFADRRLVPLACDQLARRSLHEIPQAVVGDQELFDLCAQRRRPGAGLVEIGQPRGGIFDVEQGQE